MIPGFICLLIPFAPGCDAYVRETPAISRLLEHRAYYSGKNVAVTGRVENIDRWKSHAGDAEELFLVCDGRCIRVYMEAHSQIRDGELVTVQGAYYKAYRVGRKTYFDEIEGTEVLPRE
jgi:hypothetical protein